MDSTIQCIILVVLLMLSGLFSASETALMSMSKIKLRKMKEDNIKNVGILSKIMEDPSKLLSTILVANNMVNIGASSIATALFMEKIGASGVPIATFIMTILVLVFGEITPKSIATTNPDKIAVKISKPIFITMKLLAPIVWILNGARKFIFLILGIKEKNNQPLITEEDLIAYVNVSHEEGVIEMEEKEIIHNVFAFGDLQAKQAMINRMDIVAVDKDVQYSELVSIFENEKLSRIPIYDDTIDNVIGIVNLKNVAFLNEDKIKNFDVTKYMIEPFFTYEFKNVSELLEELKIQKVQMAIVLDEYGGTAGLLTLENLLEEIVGDINDEFDNEELEIIKIQENEYRIKGNTSLLDINEQLNLSLESEDVDSIAGYIIENLKGFPEKGEQLSIDNITFTVEEVEKNKVNLIKVNIK